MEKGVGKSFSSILQIISQWRAKSRDDLKHEYHRKPSIVYVFPEASESSFDIEVFRKEPDWFEQPMTRFKLYHTIPAVGCLYVKFRTLPETVLNRRKLDLWKNTLLDTFRSSLKNHIGPVDQAGILRKSKQPTINQFLYELKTPTNLYLSAGTKVMESPKERYVPQSSIDTRQVEKGLEAPKLSMYNQIENVMKLAGDLYESRVRSSQSKLEERTKNNVTIYCAAQVFYQLGYSAMDFTITIFVADTSSLRNRAWWIAYTASPWLINTWCYGPDSTT
ncbi:hypothetical protein KCU71_g3388, partial [Aureobasidium melanogenum]